MELRYYQYISEEKINMLYGQLSSVVTCDSTITGGLNCGIASSQSTISSHEEVSIYAKLSSVEAKLRSAGAIGSVEEVKEYISGQLVMPLNFESDIAIWSGKSIDIETKTMYVIVLHGSKINLIGYHEHTYYHEGSIRIAYFSAVQELLAKVMSEDEIEGLHDYELMETTVSSCPRLSSHVNFLAKIENHETLSVDYLKKNSPDKYYPSCIDKVTYILATPLFVNETTKPDTTVRFDETTYICANISDLKKKYNKPRHSKALIDYVSKTLRSVSYIRLVDFQRDIHNSGFYADNSDIKTLWTIVERYIHDKSK